MKKFFIAIILLLTAATSWAQNNQSLTVAFGSCNRQNLEQPMWDFIGQNNPDLWVWLGDNIYGDSNDMNVIKAKYDLQLSNLGYQKLIAKTKVIGTWDDHDYGKNDAGKEYPHKKETQQLALDFFNVPKNSPLRSIEGLYSANTYQVGGKTVKFILLDGRYHRDTINKVAGKNSPNETGDILGEKQWDWLANELKSKADLYVIGSGIQILSEEHPYEKWANFPKAKQRLLTLLQKSKVNGAILLSGDRHIGEFSKTEIKGLNFPLFDVTSSGLTHSSTNNISEKNSQRVGPLINQKHYGLMLLAERNQKLEVEISLKGLENVNYHTEKLIF